MFKIKNISDKKIEIIIFFISFFLFLILGIIITYTFNFLNNSNLIFEADNYRVINDISALSTNHYRINVHPLFLIIMQPIYYLLFSLTLNRMISIIILSSLVNVFSLTPYTIVGKSFPAGADITTFLAPAVICADAFSFDV